METEKRSLNAEELRRIREQADKVLEAERLAALKPEELRRIQEQADQVLGAERSATLKPEELRRIQEQADELAEAKRLEMLARMQERARASEKKMLTPNADATQASGKKQGAPQPPMERKSSRKGYLTAGLLIIGSVLFLVYGLKFLDTKLPGATTQASSGERQQAPAEAKPVPAAESVAKAEPPAAKAEAPASTSATKQNMEPEIRSAVTQWADAWSRRDATAYLAFYAAEFQPPQGMSRSEWEAQRKAKLDKYRSIHVALKNVKVSYTGGDAQVSFTQDFKADSFKELGTRKVLRMKNIQGRWMIVSEAAQ